MDSGRRYVEIGVSSSILVVASRSWVQNLCRYSGRENAGSKRCLRDLRVYMRFVMCDVKVPVDVWYICSLCTEDMPVGRTIFVVTGRCSESLRYTVTIGAQFNNYLSSGVLFRVEVERQ